MKSRDETTDDALSSTMTASFTGAVRHAMFATAVALPLAMIASVDGFESDSDCTSAGELWLDVQNRMKVATERLN